MDDRPPQPRTDADMLRRRQRVQAERQRRWVSERTTLAGIGAVAATFAFAGCAAQQATTTADSSQTTAATRVSSVGAVTSAPSSATQAQQTLSDGSNPSSFDDGSDLQGSGMAPQSGGFGGGGMGHGTSGGS